MREGTRFRNGLAFLCALGLLAASLGPVAFLVVDADSTGSLLELSLRSRCGELMSDDTAEIRALLTADGIGIPGAQIVVRSSTGILTSPVDLGAGEYAFSWTAPVVTRPTYFSLYVRAVVEGYDDAMARIVFLVDPHRTNTMNPTQIFLFVRPSSTTVRPGGTVDVMFFAHTIEGYIISGATVTLLQAGPGTLSPVRVSGCGYAFTFTAPSSIPGPTGVLITISANKLGYSAGTARLSLLITG